MKPPTDTEIDYRIDEAVVRSRGTTFVIAIDRKATRVQQNERIARWLTECKSFFPNSIISNVENKDELSIRN